MDPQRILTAVFAWLMSPAALAATIATIDQGPVAGRPSIAIGSDDMPVIAYHTLTNGLRIARCRDIDCNTSNAIDIGSPPTGMASGLYNSIAIAADGNPAIAFRDPIDHQLKLVKCTNIDCSGGGYEFRTIDAGPHSVGLNVTMAFDADGKAVFAYQDSTDNALMLARCGNTGCGVVDIETIDVNGGAGNYWAGVDTAIAIGSAGNITIAEHWTNSSTGSAAIKLFTCTAAPCAGNWQMIDYAVGHPVGSALSMVLRADHRPVFSYHDDADDDLLFAACSTTDCSGFEIYEVVDAGSLGAGAFSAVAVRPDGRPVIAYQKSVTVAGGGQALYVAECEDADCHDTDRFALDLQPGLNTGEDVSIAIGADGGAAIAYFDQSALKLRFAKCNPQGCRGPGDRLFADGFD